MSDVPPEPAPTYLQLRSRILSLDPAEVGLTPSNTSQKVWGVLMETGYVVGTATLVALADGTTSLYYSTGGGLLGSGEYSPVAVASKALVTQAENYLQYMSSADKFPLPAVGQVWFVLLAYSDTFTIEASEKTLSTGKHPLSPLFTLGHEIMTQLHLLAEKKRK
jgi:hypothetical protein